MGVQLRCADRRGSNFAVLFVRCLWILAAIGVVHATLIWAGDIPLLSATMGAIISRLGVGPAALGPHLAAGHWVDLVRTTRLPRGAGPVAPRPVDHPARRESVWV
jgi:hypothetical protein